MLSAYTPWLMRFDFLVFGRQQAPPLEFRSVDQVSNYDGFEYRNGSSVADLPGLFWCYARSALYA